MVTNNVSDFKTRQGIYTEAITVDKKESADVQNPALKSYASRHCRFLQNHLDAAKALQKSKATTKDM
jgi:hypothetical protein